MNIVKIGSVELTEQEAENYYNDQKYICTSTTVYQIFYSQAQKQYYGQKIIQYKGLARRGRFYALKAHDINHIIGKKILRVE